MTDAQYAELVKRFGGGPVVERRQGQRRQDEDVSASQYQELLRRLVDDASPTVAATDRETKDGVS